MKKKLLAFTLPAGLLLWLIDTMIQRFFFKIPNAAAYPIMIVSILLMLTGLAYHGFCLGKKRNPYQF